LALGLVVLAALLAASFAAFISLPQLDTQRRAVLANFLGRLNDRPVEISGPVDVSVSSLTTVTISDIAVGERGASTTAHALHIREAVLSFPPAKLLQGKLEIQALAITGITFELLTANATGDAGQLMQQTGDMVVGMLRSDFAQNVSLRDMTFIRRDDPDGWNGEIDFKDITPVEGETDGSLSVKADGTFSGSPLSVGLSVAPPVVGSAGASRHPFDLGISVAGATATLKGDLGAEGESMDAVLAIDVNSFGDLLEVLRLRRDAEGKGQVSMHLSGQLDALKASSVKTTLEFENGERATINGEITNAVAASGIDLNFDLSLRGEGGAGVSVDDEFDLELEAMRGHVLGDLQDLTVEKLALTTNNCSNCS
jgi:hypothetical protein